jgi:acyl carrier protein
MGREGGMSRSAIEQELQNFICTNVVRRGKSVTLDLALVQSGLVDSLGLLQIVAYIESTYGVDLTKNGGPEDFKSISSLAAAVCRMKPQSDTSTSS